MTIQINTYKIIEGENRLQKYYISLIEEKLKRFESHLTRIEVHLSDENGEKEGKNQILCMLEARMEGRQPIAVTCKADVPEKAISSAIDKLTSSLTTIIGRIKNY
jgi:ribosome-associated translation inhibitor RaiA